MASGDVLKALDCPEASYWESLCARARGSRGAIELDVQCIASSTSVQGVRSCHVKCIDR
jgi:hypothetical protein